MLATCMINVVQPMNLTILIIFKILRKFYYLKTTGKIIFFGYLQNYSSRFSDHQAFSDRKDRNLIESHLDLTLNEHYSIRTTYLYTIALFHK